MTANPSFSFSDICGECEVEYQVHHLDGRDFGIKIHVPPALYRQHPFNASVYELMQTLREPILEHGTVEFPLLPINKSNYTLAQRAPKEHRYSPNPYMTDICQHPHQDTPPYPTAFGLDQPRKYFATWLMGPLGAQEYYRLQAENPQWDVEELHRRLVPKSLQAGSAVLVNQQPGLLMFDNSERHKLYHARTCNFDAVAENPDYTSDSPMYAFNEVGLLNYIDQLDIRRGDEFRDAAEVERVREFMQREQLGPM